MVLSPKYLLLCALVTGLNGCRSRDSDIHSRNEDDPDFSELTKKQDDKTTLLQLRLGDVAESTNYICWYEVPITVESKEVHVDFSQPKLLSEKFVSEEKFLNQFEFLTKERKNFTNPRSEGDPAYYQGKTVYDERTHSESRSIFKFLTSISVATAAASFVGVPAPILYAIPFAGFAARAAARTWSLNIRAPGFLKDEMHNSEVMVAAALIAPEEEKGQLKLIPREMIYYVKLAMSNIRNDNTINPKLPPFEKWIDKGESLSGDNTLEKPGELSCASYFQQMTFPKQASYSLRK